MPASIETIQKNLESDKRFRERRHPQWTDNYLLDRDTVITNRLTQRQSVNVPMMKETRKTILARGAGHLLREPRQRRPKGTLDERVVEGRGRAGAP